MNKLIIGIIVVLILVVGGAYLIGLDKTEAPTNTDTQDQQQDMNTGEDQTDEMDTSDTGTTTDGETPEPVTIDITGENFEFLTEDIVVKKGTRVTINFTSTDGFHDLTVDAFETQTERVNTGESTSVTFIADKVGTFSFHCSVGNHRHLGMEGMLIVEE